MSDPFESAELVDFFPEAPQRDPFEDAELVDFPAEESATPPVLTTPQPPQEQEALPPLPPGFFRDEPAEGFVTRLLDELADASPEAQAEVERKNQEALALMRAATIGDVEDPLKLSDASFMALHSTFRDADYEKEQGLIELNRNLGIPIDLARENFDLLQRTAREAKMDPQQWRLRNPALYDWLKEDRTRAPLVFKEDNAVQRFIRSVGRRIDVADVGGILTYIPPEKMAEVEARLGAFDKEREAMIAEGRGDWFGEFRESAYEETSQAKEERRIEKMEEAGEIGGSQAAILKNMLMITGAWGEFQRAQTQDEIAFIGSDLLAAESKLRSLLAAGDDSSAVASEVSSLRLKRDRLQDELGRAPRSYGESVGTSLVTQMSSVVGQQWGSLKALGAGGGGGFVLGGIVGLAGSFVTKDPTLTMKLAGAGAALGSRAVPTMRGYYRERGGLYNELEGVKDDQGNPIDPDVREVASVLGGAVSGAVEGVSLGPFMRGVFGQYGGAVLAGKGVKEVMERQLSTAAGRAFWKDLAKRWVAAGAGEGAEELTQTLVQFVSVWKAKEASAGEPQKFEYAEALPEAFTAAGIGAMAGFGLGAPNLMISTASEMSRAVQHKDNAAAIEAITEVAKSSEARAAPKDVARLIEIATKQSKEKIDRLYIDPVRFAEEATNEGIDPLKAAVDLMGETGAERLQAAMRDAGDKPGSKATLEVPLTEYLEKWGSTNLAERLKQDIATTADGFTQRELGVLNQQSITDLARKLVKGVAAGVKGEEIEGVGMHEANFSGQVEAKMINAGIEKNDAKHITALVQAFTRRMATMLGKDAEETFKNFSLDIGNEADVRPADASIWLSKHLDALDPKTQEGLDARARIMYVDTNTGLGNDRAFLARDLDPEAKFVAFYSFEGTKWKNREGHTPGNELYRLVGQALAELADDAAKWGGDFVSTAKTEKEAKDNGDLLAAMVKERLQKANPEIAADIEGLQIVTTTAPLGADRAASINVAKEINTAERTRRELLPDTAKEKRAKRGESPLGLPMKEPQQLLLPKEPAAVRELHPSLVEKARTMSNEEIFDAAYYDRNMGMLTGQAFFALPKRKHVIALDLNGLRAFNDNIGTDVGDAMLRAFAKAANAVGGSAFDFAHLSGDEFAAMADTAEDAQLFVDMLAEVLNVVDRANELQVVIAATEENPERTIHGISFGYGIGEDYDSADAKTEESKARGEDAERVARRHRSVARGEADLRQRAELSERGSRAQAYAGASRQRRTRSGEDRLAETRRREGRRRVDAARFAALQNSRPEDIAAAIASAASTPELGVILDRAAERLQLKAAIEAAERDATYKSVDEAWGAVVDASFHGGESPISAIEDSRYSIAKADSQAESQSRRGLLAALRAQAKARGEDPKKVKIPRRKSAMPGPYGGVKDGTFDPANNYLNLSGKGKVKGARHAFEQLYYKIPGTKDEKIVGAIEILQEVKGLEGIRVPDALAEKLAEKQRAKELEEYAAERQADAEQEAAEASAQFDTSFDPDAIEAMPDPDDPDVFYQPVGDDVEVEGYRGYIEINRNGLQLAMRIMLGEQADASTMLHELGHAYLEMIQQLADHPEAGKRLGRDYDAILRFLDAKRGEELTEEQKEKFARGFEVFLMEGKAPSSRLAAAFQTFSLWLKSVYRTVDELGVELNDEIRGVFGRLLASDEQVGLAADAAGLTFDVFRTAEEAGLEGDSQEWLEFLDGKSRATRSAAIKAAQSIANAKLKATEAWKSAEFKRLKQEAFEEYRNRKDVKAFRFLRHGETVTEDGETLRVSGAGKMHRADALNVLGDRLPAMEAKLKGRFIKSGGAHPDDYAAQLGYDSATEMFAAIDSMPDEDTEVDAMARAKMKAAHPDIDAEIESLQADLQRLLHGQKTAQWLMREIRMLRRKAGGKESPISAEVLKETAREMAETYKVSGLSPDRILQKERAAARESMEAATKGNYSKAYTDKQRQLIYHYLWREVRDAKKRAERVQSRLKKMAKDTYIERAGKVSPEHRDVLLTLLEKLGARKKERSAEPRHDMGNLEKVLGEDVAFDGMAIRAILSSGVSRLADLTLPELRTVDDFTANMKADILHKTKIQHEGRAVALEELIAVLKVEANEAMPDAWFPESTAAKGFFAKQKENIAAFDAAVWRQTEMLESLGGMKSGSMWDRVFVRRVRAAEAKFNDLMNRVIKPTVEAMNAIPKDDKRWDDPIDARALFPNHRPEVLPRTRGELLMMVLYRGNESNIQRLEDGRNITTAELDAAIAKHITSAEMQWVQSVWDAFEGMWAESAEVEERDKGVRPEKLDIQAFTVKTKDGEVTMRGGYIPAVYDSQVSSIGKMVEIRELADVLSPMSRAATNRDQMKKRRREVKGEALSLNPNHIIAGLQKRARDIAFRETVRDLWNLTNNKELAETMRRKLGPERYATFNMWLRDMATYELASVNRHVPKLDKWARAIRSNLTTAVLGYRIGVAIADMSNIAIMSLVSPVSAKMMGQTFTAFMRDPKAAIKEASEKSGVVRQRNARMIHDAQRTVYRMQEKRGAVRRAYDAYMDNAFITFEWVDRLTSAFYFHVGYNQALAEGKSEAEAIAHGEHVVSKTLPATTISEMSALQRDRGLLGHINIFYGYFSLKYQQQRAFANKIHTAKTTKERNAAIRQGAGKMIAMSVFTTTIPLLIMGRGPEEEDGDDDLERWAHWLARSTALSAFEALPFGMVQGMEDAWMHVVQGRSARFYGGRYIPGWALLEEASRAVKKLGKAIHGDGDVLDVLGAVARALAIRYGAPLAPATAYREIQELLDASDEVGYGDLD